MILQQVAFTSGRLPVAATAMTIANPLVGTVLAVIGFSEALPSTAGGLAGLAFGAALVCVGVYVLAHSPLLAEPLPAPAELATEAGGWPHHDRPDDGDRDDRAHGDRARHGPHDDGSDRTREHGDLGIRAWPRMGPLIPAYRRL